MPIPHMEYNDLKLPLSYSLVFQTFQQPTLTCHVSWQHASSAFLRLGSAASCSKTVAPVDKLCLQSVPRDNTLILRQRHKPQIPEHIQTCSCSSSPSACAVGGDPNVLVVLIPSYSKNISENIEDLLFALLPWNFLQSGSLGVSENWGCQEVKCESTRIMRIRLIWCV